MYSSRGTRPHSLCADLPAPQTRPSSLEQSISSLHEHLSDLETRGGGLVSGLSEDMASRQSVLASDHMTLYQSSIFDQVD